MAFFDNKKINNFYGNFLKFNFVFLMQIFKRYNFTTIFEMNVERTREG